MHFSLLTAPTVTEFRSHAELRSAAVQGAAREPQLGILNVAAILEEWGDLPGVFDANAAYMRYAIGSPEAEIDGFADHLAETAIRSNADVYGLSTICSTYPLTLRIARAIKERRPYSTILLGGPQASVVDVATMEAFPWIDFVLRGEVEQSLPLLLQEMHRDYDFSRVPGLTFRDSGVVQRTPNAPVIEDLDAMPSPAYHLGAHLEGATSAPIELGRGCPFACTFCSTNDFFRRRFRLRSPARVLQEMRMLHDRYGIRDFDLVHDMFTVDRKRVVAFCDAMAASGDGFTWRCSARTDCVDEALLEQMAKSGCRSVFFGIESGSRRMQRIIDKDLDPDYAQEMLAAAERHGMRSTASLIAGFPEERWEDVRDTLRIFARSARCSRSHPQLNLLAPLANTPIFHAHKHEMELEELCSDMSHQGLSQCPEDLNLIRTYPEIFSNFYMLPAPELDREVLFELRQLLTVAVELFRWPVCRIAQRTDLLQFHKGWRACREGKTGKLAGSALRLYYVGQRFRPDFVAFLKEEFPDDGVMTSLLRVDEAITLAADRRDGNAGPNEAAPGEALGAEDEVGLSPATLLLTLPYDLDEMIGALAANTEPQPQRPIPYATLRGADDAIQMRRITPVLAAALEQCTGERLADVAARLSRSLIATSGGQLDTAGGMYFATELLRGAHRDGWLTVHRRKSVAAAEKPGTPFSKPESVFA